MLFSYFFSINIENILQFFSVFFRKKLNKIGGKYFSAVRVAILCLCCQEHVLLAPIERLPVSNEWKRIWGGFRRTMGEVAPNVTIELQLTRPGLIASNNSKWMISWSFYCKSIILSLLLYICIPKISTHFIILTYTTARPIHNQKNQDLVPTNFLSNHLPT